MCSLSIATHRMQNSSYHHPFTKIHKNIYISNFEPNLASLQSLEAVNRSGLWLTYQTNLVFALTHSSSFRCVDKLRFCLVTPYLYIPKLSAYSNGESTLKKSR